MKLSRTSSMTLHLSASMSLAGNYPPHTEASYSQHYYGSSPYELQPVIPPPAVDAPYHGWPLSSCKPEISQDSSEQPQIIDYYSTRNVKKPVKKRTSANRKERRRTMSINNAFQELRECIPNVPSDTKLSKIKTLKLATSYITYLCDVLAQDDPNSAPSPGGFKDELCTQLDMRGQKRRAEAANLMSTPMNYKKSTGRTGWPEHVWALELKHET